MSYIVIEYQSAVWYESSILLRGSVYCAAGAVYCAAQYTDPRSSILLSYQTGTIAV